MKIIKYLIFAAVFFLQGCASSPSSITDEKFQTAQGKVWIRHEEEWDEILLLDDDGTFYYYYPDAGNAVDDYDLCDTYEFSESDESLHLHCNGAGSIDIVRVKELNEKELKLDFNGEIRTFQIK